MENQTQKLSDYVQNLVNQDDQTTGPSFNAFLTVYSINIVHRFPGTSVDLNTIEVPTIENVAKLAIGCSSIGLDVWQDTFSRRQRGGGGVAAARRLG